MKKIYQKPEFKVIELKARHQLLVGSITEKKNEAEEITEGYFE